MNQNEENKDDRLLKKNDILPILRIGRNTLYELINSGEFIKPVSLPGIKLDLYSNNELQKWIDEQKNKRSIS